MIIDITDAKLRNAEFKGIVRAISQAQGMADIDLDGRIIFSNRRFIDLSGYPAEQLEGRHLQQLLVSGQFDPQQWQKVREGEYLAGEYTLRHANGSSIHTQIYFNPIIDAYGRPAKVVMLVTDLSERHRMELALLAAKERAELAAESKGAFLANMSHEIRTPMNAIIGFSEVLLNESLSSTQRKYLKTVNQSARSLLGLLNDILDTAKLEKGAVQLEEHAFSLRDLCRQLINVFSLEAGQKGLALEFDYHAQQEHYRGDPMRVRQVLTNLLGNAIKFTRQGSVRLQVDAGGKRLAGTGQHDHMRLPGIRHPFQPLAQLFQQRHVQGIQALRPVQGDRRDTMGAVDQHRVFFGHSVFLSPRNRSSGTCLPDLPPQKIPASSPVATRVPSSSHCSTNAA